MCEHKIYCQFTKLSKLEAFIHNLELKPDIIVVTETWIQSNAPGSYYNLSGYVFVSTSRKSHRGGGVGVCIKLCIIFL